MEPEFERSFIGDSYPSRRNKGTHAGVRRCQEFALVAAWPTLQEAIRRAVLAIVESV